MMDSTLASVTEGMFAYHEMAVVRHPTASTLVCLFTAPATGVPVDGHETGTVLRRMGVYDHNVAMLRLAPHSGVAEGDRDRILQPIRDLILALQPISYLCCVGVCRGAVAAITYGYCLGANEVVAFRPTLKGPGAIVYPESIALIDGGGTTKYRIYYSGTTREEIDAVESMQRWQHVELNPLVGDDASLSALLRSNRLPRIGPG